MNACTPEFETPKMTFVCWLYLPREVLQQKDKFVLFELLLNEHLREFKYKAGEADIRCRISRTFYGLKVHVSGFTDKLDVFTQALATKLKTFLCVEASSEYIRVILDTAKLKKRQRLEDALRKKPYQQIWRLAYKLFLSNACEYKELIKIVDRVSLEEYLEFHKKVLSRALVDQALVGDSTFESVSHFHSAFVGTLRECGLLEPFDYSDIMEKRPLQLKPKTIAVFLEEVTSPQETNSSVAVFFESPRDTNSEHINQALAAYLHSEFFADLRTERQVGYAVFARGFRVNQTDRFAFEVQSGEFLPSEVAGLTYAFLDRQRAKLKDLPEARFGELTKGVQARFREKFPSLAARASFLTQRVEDGSLNFCKREQAVEALEGLTKDKFVEYFEDTFFRDPRVCEVHLVSRGNFHRNEQLVKKKGGLTRSSFDALEVSVYKEYRDFVRSHVLGRDECLGMRFGK